MHLCLSVHQLRFSSTFQLHFKTFLNIKICVLVAGNLSRKCTEAGWSDVYPTVVVACWSDNIDEPSEVSLAPPLRPDISVSIVCGEGAELLTSNSQ